MALELSPGESRGYWKYHAPGKWFKQAKAIGKVNNEKADLLFDSGAEVSILDITFARKVGCYVDESQTQECVGIGENSYRTEGRTKIKITLAGSLVYFFYAWVGTLSGQDAILGMDFMVPAGIRLDLADGTLCLPDEVRIQLSGRRQLYNGHARTVTLGQDVQVPVADYVEVPLRTESTDHQKLWVTRGECWVPTVTPGPGRTRYLRLTNVSDHKLALHQDLRVGIWLANDGVPRLPGFVSVGSRRYAEWQNLAFQATTNGATQDEPAVEADDVPAIERSSYPAPTTILKRPLSVSTLLRKTMKSDEDEGAIKSPADLKEGSANEPTENLRDAPSDNMSEILEESHLTEGFDDQSRSDISGIPETGIETCVNQVEGQAGETATKHVGNRVLNVVGRSPEMDQDAGHVAEVGTWTNHDQEHPPDRVDPGTKPGPKKRHASADDLLEDAQVCFKEGGELFAEDLENQMAVLPEVTGITEEVKIEDIQVGDPAVNTPEEISRLRDIIWRYRHLLIGKGNALPPAATGAVCDIDVGSARPIAQRVRKVAPQFREKLSNLIKGLLNAKIIQPSTSPWASPIVVVIKKNGVDIRLCIDYRLVNSLTRLMVYPMPLINDLLEDLEKVLWYCSLDMASGFWVVSMTNRARLISAFITPFGLFEWLRMPFGLKNAPQIYQRLLDNALYGFLRIKPTPDQRIPDLGTPDFTAVTSREVRDLFQVGEPDPSQNPSTLGRRSYIDDILVTAESWADLCVKVEKLLEVCNRWNLSISMAKSFWGYRKVDYLGHRVSAEGLEAHPKDLSTLADLPFPETLRAMQSFLGSLNYYSRFIEDFAIYAAILYELREMDFHEMVRRQKSPTKNAEAGGHRPTLDDSDAKWKRAESAFQILKDKLVTAPILQHFNPDRQAVVVVYASEWAISAALIQEYDGIYKPVMFTSRTLKSNELNYGIVDKEVLALIRILDVCYTLLVTRPIRVLTRHSTLAWLFRSSGFQGRLGRWAAILSSWTLEIVKCVKGEDEILGVLAASITPREDVDAALISIAPKKQPKQVISVPPPTVEPGEELWVVSFDESAKVKRNGGAYSAIVWSLPGWNIAAAASEYMPDLTVNEAEYRGLLLCFRLLSSMDRGRIIICGDSNLVIRQMRGEIDCKAPGLMLLREQAMDCLRSWPDHQFLHMKRDWNQSADRLASTALQRQEGIKDLTAEEHENLITLNRLDELIAPRSPDTIVRVTALTRSGTRRRLDHPVVLDEEVVRQKRVERILTAQNEEKWIADLKKYLSGEVSDLTSAETKICRRMSDDYEVDDSGLLFYCPVSRASDEERDLAARLVIPETLQADILHHYHTSLEGGHQGIGRTYHRIKAHFHWRGLYRSVQQYVGQCVDCETGKGNPTLQGKSPGNMKATYPFQIVAMDHIPSLPKSHKGNTELLIWVDLFTGYVIAKASASRTAQIIAENYEECVFRRFGASEAIRHDREPGFMSDFFRSFNRIVGQQQRATMAYRPQANGTAERMVQTLTRALKIYVAEVDQKDWDEYAERLTFALNTAHDRVRGDTPFYLVHGWDPRSTLEAMIPLGNTRRQDAEPRRWRYHIQQHYQRAREQVNERLRTAIEDRAERHNEDLRPHGIKAGSRVWLFLDRVKEGFARKLAHMWHGPFRVAEIVDMYAAKLEVAGTGYQVFPVVHVSKLKQVRDFPDRPKVQLTVDEQNRLDFDEALLPEDSWITGLDEGEFEVEKLSDMRTGRRTRYGRVHREFLVHWKGYDEPTWIDEADLNCGALLHEYLRRQASQNRFSVMHSQEEE